MSFEVIASSSSDDDSNNDAQRSISLVRSDILHVIISATLIIVADYVESILSRLRSLYTNAL